MNVGALRALAECWQLRAANMASWTVATEQLDMKTRAAERARCAYELGVFAASARVEDEPAPAQAPGKESKAPSEPITKCPACADDDLVSQATCVVRCEDGSRLTVCRECAQVVLDNEPGARIVVEVPREQPPKDLAGRIAALPTVEQRIVAAIVGRLEQGRADYGDWPADDSRDLRRETFEEVVDAAVYAARALLRGWA
jgi:hypothetical protein